MKATGCIVILVILFISTTAGEIRILDRICNERYIERQWQELQKLFDDAHQNISMKKDIMKPCCAPHCSNSSSMELPKPYTVEINHVVEDNIKRLLINAKILKRFIRHLKLTLNRLKEEKTTQSKELVKPMKDIVKTIKEQRTRIFEVIENYKKDCSEECVQHINFDFRPLKKRFRQQRNLRKMESLYCLLSDLGFVYENFVADIYERRLNKKMQ